MATLGQGLVILGIPAACVVIRILCSEFKSGLVMGSNGCISKTI
jgi:hypothetical protein